MTTKDDLVVLEPAALALAQRLGHTFEKPALLRNALTHRSLANERPDTAPTDNERLEFLGDAVVGMVVAAQLYGRFPGAAEGELTRRRADLVSESALAAIARNVDLGAALRLGKGEDRSGGRSKSRLLASAFEACIGAIYRDGGFEAAYEVVERLFAARVASSMLPGALDFKSRAQEWAQAHIKATPTYRLLDSSGPDHQRRFTAALQTDGQDVATGQGGSKAEAEQEAARAALELWLED